MQESNIYPVRGLHTLPETKVVVVVVVACPATRWEENNVGFPMRGEEEEGRGATAQTRNMADCVLVVCTEGGQETPIAPFSSPSPLHRDRWAIVAAGT